MKTGLVSILFMIALGFTGYTFAQNDIAVIPAPKAIEQKGGSFIINGATYIASVPDGNEWNMAIQPLREKLNVVAGIQLKDRLIKSGNTIIVEKINMSNEEAYELEISPASLKIKSATAKGAFYAVQTLLQLLPASIESGKSQNIKQFELPSVQIKDEPAFGYRGLMIDVSRHFMLVSDIKKLIDGLAMLKINTLHWHLSDSQGWRFESKKYPKLTEIGAFRKGTPYHYTYDYDSRPREEVYGGYYTQDQLRDVVAYAQQKFITIIPEIDMPAHSTSALASYPQLLCSDMQGHPRPAYDFGDGCYCMKEETFSFLFEILDELISVFPSEYIHIGGDEAAKSNWKQCKYCNQRMNEEHLKDYEELQSYFIKRICAYLVSKHRKPIGWDEILQGGLAPDATVMSWRGEKGGIEAVKQGHEAIMTPVSHCYYDYYLSNEDDEPAAWGGYIPLQKVYNYQPVPAELNSAEATLIKGAQANLWTEYVPDFVQASYMIFPRIAAMSEVVWTNPSNRNYLGFVKRLSNVAPRLKDHQLTVSPHRYEVMFENKQTAKGLILKLRTVPGASAVHYTLDGSLPTLTSPVLHDSLLVDKDATVTAAIFDEAGNITDKANCTYIKHKGTQAKFTQLVQPDKPYNDGGDRAVDNGVVGSGRTFKDNEWLGYNGKTFTGIFEFNSSTEISTISTRFFHDHKRWVWFPTEVEVLVSDDGENYQSVYKEQPAVPIATAPVPYKINLNHIRTKYLKLVAKPLTVIPKGYNGAGKPSWMLIDEILVQ